MKKQIVNTGLDATVLHRQLIDECPNCNYEMNFKTWETAAYQLILTPRVYKSGYVSTVTECPKCFKSSWVHIRVSGFGYGEKYPKKWIEAVDNLRESILKSAAIEWKKSLCHTCKHRYSEPAEYNNWRRCIVGVGGPETVCSKYENGKPSIKK